MLICCEQPARTPICVLDMALKLAVLTSVQADDICLGLLQLFWSWLVTSAYWRGATQSVQGPVAILTSCLAAKLLLVPKYTGDVRCPCTTPQYYACGSLQTADIQGNK